MGRHEPRKARPPNAGTPLSSGPNCGLPTTRRSAVAPPSRKQLHEPGQARTTGPAGTPTRSISPRPTKALAKIRNIPTHPKVKPPDRQDHEHRHHEHAYAHEQEENDEATPEKIE